MIVLIGGCGFLGRFFKSELNLDEFPSVVCVHLNTTKQKLSHECEKFVDFKNSQAIHFSDLIIINFYAPFLNNREISTDSEEFVNLIGAWLEVLDVIPIENVKKFINISTASLYSNHPCIRHRESCPIDVRNAYTYFKYRQEQEIENIFNNTSTNLVNLRFTNLYGPNDFHANSLITKIAESIGKTHSVDLASDVKRDYLFLSDAVKAIRNVLDRKIDSGTYNVGTGISTTSGEIIQAFENVINHRLMWNERDGHVFTGHNVVDNTKFRVAAKWEPAIALKTGIFQLLNKLEEI